MKGERGNRYRNRSICEIYFLKRLAQKFLGMLALVYKQGMMMLMTSETWKISNRWPSGGAESVDGSILYGRVSDVLPKESISGFG